MGGGSAAGKGDGTRAGWFSVARGAGGDALAAIATLGLGTVAADEVATVGTALGGGLWAWEIVGAGPLAGGA